MGMRYDQDVGSPANQRSVQITSTPTKITLTSPKYKTLELFNADANNMIYFGDANVIAGSPPVGTGMPFFPGDFRHFKGVQSGFQVWLVCASGQTAYITICEYP